MVYLRISLIKSHMFYSFKNSYTKRILNTSVRYCMAKVVINKKWLFVYETNVSMKWSSRGYS